MSNKDRLMTFAVVGLCLYITPGLPMVFTELNILNHFDRSILPKQNFPNGTVTLFC